MKNDDIFEFLDETSDREKAEDKLCSAIFLKVKELFETIQNSINENILINNQEEKTVVDEKFN